MAASVLCAVEHKTDAATGYQLWSRSFDRDQTDILQVQGEIAEAVTRSLRVSLMGDESARLTLGESANPAAVDAYLRGLKLQNSDNEVPDHAHEAMAAFDEAIRLDPGYALAEVGRAYSFLSLAAWGPDQADFKTLFQHALTAANRAVALAPALGAAHAARACALAYTLAFAEAAAEYKTAMDLSPNDVEVKMSYSNFEVAAGHFARGLEAVQQAVNLDPLQPAVYTAMAWSLMLARRYDEALVAQRHARLLMNDGNARHSGQLGYVELLEGDAQSARRDCEAGHDWLQVACLAMAYHALGRQGEAEAQLARLHGMMGDSGAYNYATIYAQWGRTADALRWLGTAFQLHDSGLAILRVDPMLDPIRGTQEYKEIEKRLTLSP